MAVQQPCTHPRLLAISHTGKDPSASSLSLSGHLHFQPPPTAPDTAVGHGLPTALQQLCRPYQQQGIIKLCLQPWPYPHKRQWLGSPASQGLFHCQNNTHLQFWGTNITCFLLLRMTLESWLKQALPGAQLFQFHLHRAKGDGASPQNSIS